ncbi:TIGR03118 family protein [Terriglobus roseus]|uniref:TIGR03118 family protein n=1 Tax=Terriglobus roseus TaxID=392734 RepID=A0A1G7GTW7_9BACT|nr:TIGR03118 family protein [Terriglobus roseus]SDE91541.1 TIGR03118 family protein [Terriglobus roseus]
MQMIRKFLLHTAAILAATLPIAGQSYKVTNLLSDGSVTATNTDPNFKNPWAISASGTFWISAANTGYNYVVPPAGTVSFKVIVPSAAAPNTAPGLPAGSVTTGGAVGMLLANGTKASFLFSTLDGTISGWNSKLGTANAISTVAINNNAAGASYPGLAILNIASGGVTSKSYILAANFGTGNAIEVYDSTFAPTKLAGNFVDPTLPAGYAPFSVHVLGTQVFVNYALRSASAPYLSVNGAGNGAVSVFDTSGNFVSRVATGGNLNAPWGIAYAPANFGIFSNDLLIGNFGDGIINVFDPKTFAYQGQLIDSTGKALKYASLWELLTGGTSVTGTTAVAGGDTSTVYFTAGLDQEQHGLFATITNATTAGATPTFGFSSASPSATVTAGSTAQVQLSLASVNGFSGNVSLACSGLPANATCSFSPSQASVSSTVPSIVTATITTNTKTAALQPLQRRGMQPVVAGIFAAFLLPFASLLGISKRLRLTNASRLAALTVVVLLSGLAAGGCSSGSSPQMSTTPTPAPVTPAGTSNITIAATAGSVTQQTSVALTVK